MTPEEVSAAVAHITEQIPFNRMLGLRVERFSPERVVVGFDMRPDLVGNVARNILHGGVISATLDLVGGVAALATVLVDREVGSEPDIGRVFADFGTIDLRVDYLRPGWGRQFLASGTVLRAGRRVAVTRSELHNDEGVLVAVGTGAYITG